MRFYWENGSIRNIRNSKKGTCVWISKDPKFHLETEIIRFPKDGGQKIFISKTKDENLAVYTQYTQLFSI